MWTISFDVVISLAASGHQDSTALASSIETTLADGSLESTIEANLGVSVTVDQSSIILVQSTTVAPTLNPMPAQITTVAPTLNPMPAQITTVAPTLNPMPAQITTIAPTLNPMPAQAKKRAENGSIGIIIAVAVLAILLALLACFWCGRKSRNHDVHGAVLEATVEQTFDGSERVVDLKPEAILLPEIELPVGAKVLRQKGALRRNSARDEGMISHLMEVAAHEVMEMAAADDEYTLDVRSTTL